MWLFGIVCHLPHVVLSLVIICCFSSPVRQPVAFMASTNILGRTPGDNGCTSVNIGESIHPQPGVLSCNESEVNWSKSTYYTFNYFEVLPAPYNNYARCLICKNKAEAQNSSLELAKGKLKQPFGIVKRTDGNTKCVSAHFMSAHPDRIDEFKVNEQKRKDEMAKKQEKSQSLFKLKMADGTKQLKLNKSKANDLVLSVKEDPEFQKLWDKSLLTFVSQTNCSFALVGGKPFQDLINVILKKGRYSRVPPLKLKSRFCIAKQSVKFADETRQNIVHIIRFFKTNLKGVSLTSDIWTDRNMMSYMSLTVSFLTPEMRLIRLVPFVTYFPQSHTGKNISLKVGEMLKLLELDDPTIKLYVSHDNARNCVLGFKLIDGMVQLFCVNHTIQLCLKDTFQMELIGSSVQDLLIKCHNLAVHIKKSSIMMHELESACRSTKQKFIKPVIANATRWNSTYANIHSLLRLEKAITKLSSEGNVHEYWSEFEFSNIEWRMMNGIQFILEKVLVMSKIFESDKEPTCHLVITKLYELREFLTGIKDDTSKDR